MKPGEHKTVQARILEYAGAICWSFVPREEAEAFNKYILRQHQTGAVDVVVERALDPERTRGLVWHTQGSGKTFTMVKAAERLFRAPAADKPTVLLMIDRNELEDQRRARRPDQEHCEGERRMGLPK